jgi:lipoprotein NlpI
VDTGSLDFDIGRSRRCKDCDMRGLVGLALASMAAIVILGPAAAQSSQRRVWCLNQGGTFSVDQGINGCSSIIQSGRESPRNLAVAYYSRGLAYYDKGDDDRAIAEFNEAIRLDPKFAYAYSSRGLAYDHKGDLGHADPDYNEAIRLDPKYAQAYFSRGSAYYQKGDDDRAIADYSEAIRLDPKYAYAYNNRGNAYYQKHDENRAIAEYSEAIRLDPKYAQAYFNRGVANLYAGSLPKALADLGQSSELNPKYAYAALWLHIVNTRNNLPSQLAEAAKQIDMTKWPAPLIRLFLGQTTPQALLATADDPNAKTKQRKVCEVNFYSAELALHRHAKDEATRLFRLAATNCPQNFTERAAAHAELKALDANP